MRRANVKEICWMVVLTILCIICFPINSLVLTGVLGPRYYLASFVHTTRLVDTGIYAVVRHPQYLGGILSIFVATLLFYPHWLFAVLGVPGSAILYLSAKEEEKNLIQRFGNDYLTYMQRVPRMNLVSSIIKLWR
ncbi:methyltransferase family protein [Chloroflexota bacterium]